MSASESHATAQQIGQAPLQTIEDIRGMSHQELVRAWHRELAAAYPDRRIYCEVWRRYNLIRAKEPS